jgi:hypothetical protein
MLTVILIIVAVVIVIKFFGPVLLDILAHLWDILTLPFALIGGFLGFIVEALFFLGLLWLLVALFGA